MEEVKILAKFMLIVALGILAIICLFSIATEEQKNRQSPNKDIRQSNYFYRHMYSFTSSKRLMFLFKSFFLSITAYFVFQNLLEWQSLLKSVDYIDFNAFYVASKMAVKGVNPYYAENYMGYFHFPFLYLPNILPLITPLSFFERDLSAKIFFFFNLFSLFTLLAGVLVLLKSKSRVYQTALIIACLLIFGLTWSLRMGQLTVILASTITWAIIFAKKNQNVPAGILLGISTIKPTLVILFLLYFLIKKRFSLIGWWLVTSLALTLIGFLMIQDSVTNFLQLYKSGYDLAFSMFWNSPYTSPTRIDVEVIGARLFSNNWSLAKLTSVILQLSSIIFAFRQFYIQQVKSNWYTKIHLSDISLLACISVFAFYSQSYSSSILVLVIPFLFNYLSHEILNKDVSQVKIFAWSLSVFCLLLLSHVSYFFFNYIYLGFENETYFVKTTFALIPSYALLGLTVSLCVLIRQKSLVNKSL